MIAQDNHLAIVISHTGENLRLGEIIKTLRHKHTKTIVISAYKNRTLCNMGDEFIYVASTEGADEFWMSTFFSSVKYILDIFYGMEFSLNYESNMKLNAEYEKIGKDKLWAQSLHIS